eukprot:TRINITY_DN1250_c0_g1_i1.p1 TRINITY_DN1250_c0_g1~~TRINITY_DN1250_c0_g1_i1.p1  ORF type:complete len:155 (-),score=11.27 TRINITY_DN1250_c0_g1_i1:27-491(-)
MFGEPKVVRNKNNLWTYSGGAWGVYFCLLLAGRLILGLFIDNHALVWTIVNVGHAIITYIVFHWRKGTPFHQVYQDDQTGKYDKLTVWEQFDDGVLYTPVRKVLTLIPVVLFFLAIFSAHDSTPVLIINLAVLLPILIAKLPATHKKRFFGINA